MNGVDMDSRPPRLHYPQGNFSRNHFLSVNAFFEEALAPGKKGLFLSDLASNQ